MVIVVILDFPILPFLPSTYEPLAAPLLSNNVFFTCGLFGVTLFYAWNLSAASDLVPSMIYFHLALALEKTSIFFKQTTTSNENVGNRSKSNEEDESIFSTELTNEAKICFGLHPPDRWQKGWLYYEAIRELIHESNIRFGSMLLLNHGAMFFVTSSNIFSILRWWVPNGILILKIVFLS